MSPVKSASEVFEAIQSVKGRATGYVTNFFPAQPKLDAWISRRELSVELREGLAIFFRLDRDFQHFYFCAASADALKKELAGISSSLTKPLTTDVIGHETALNSILSILENAGFRRYCRLVRLARPAPVASSSKARVDGLHQAAVSDAARIPSIQNAEHVDAAPILELLEILFDRFADQLPIHSEIENAIANGQILVAKEQNRLGAVLYFETQGVTSSVRYWAVDSRYRSLGFGSALIRHYFNMHKLVRRFVLWVTSSNSDALNKYAHYGYAPDGLVDHVLVTQMIGS